jgi:hypothetical protein
MNSITRNDIMKMYIIHNTSYKSVFERILRCKRSIIQSVNNSVMNRNQASISEQPELEVLCNDLLFEIKKLIPGNYLPSPEKLCEKLAAIAELITELAERDQEGSNAMRIKKTITTLKCGEKPPPPSSTLISIMQLRAIYTAIEVIWVIGAKFTFAEEYKKARFSDYDLTPPSMLLNKDQIDELYTRRLSSTEGSGNDGEKVDSVFKYIETILCVCKVTTFTSMMLERNMKRILVTLILLKHDPRVKSLLRELLSSRQHKYHLVCALRSLLCCSFPVPAIASLCLTQLMTSDGGLEAVVRSFLDGTSSTSIPFVKYVRPFFRI